MKLKNDKTEVQYIGKGNIQMDVRIEEEDLHQVCDFVYLGKKISADGSSTADVGRRVGLASGVM